MLLRTPKANFVTMLVHIMEGHFLTLEVRSGDQFRHTANLELKVNLYERTWFITIPI